MVCNLRNDDHLLRHEKGKLMKPVLKHAWLFRSINPESFVIVQVGQLKHVVGFQGTKRTYYMKRLLAI